jgi:hypothetical protein
MYGGKRYDDIDTLQAVEQSASGGTKGGSNFEDPTPAFWQELNVNPPRLIASIALG